MRLYFIPAFVRETAVFSADCIFSDRLVFRLMDVHVAAALAMSRKVSAVAGEYFQVGVLGFMYELRDDWPCRIVSCRACVAFTLCWNYRAI